jgi:iron-sulfur cluster assembly accessory protein
MIGEITLSDRAAEKIRKLLDGNSEEKGLRLKVVAGGCSGFEYKMAIDAPAAQDRIIEKNGARILLDANSVVHLNGTELDYKDDLMQSGFIFINPNVKSTCGCGTSFSA